MKIFFRHEQLRKGQKELLEDISQCISEKKHLIAHAPTGLGKTDSAISATLSYALENDKTVFFLTPKITQHKIAVEVVKDLAEKYNLKVKGTDLIGKKHMCVNKELLEEDSENFYDLCQKMVKFKTCPFYGNARGYSVMQKAIADANMSQVNNWYGSIKEHNEVKDFCEGLGNTLMPRIPCAYEISLQLAEHSAFIVADYNHLLTTVASNILKKTSKDIKDSIVIIDEAHNAPERIRNALTSSLDTFTLEKAAKEAKTMNHFALAKYFREIEQSIKSQGVSINKEERIFKESIPEIDLKMIFDIRELGYAYIQNHKKHVSCMLEVADFYEQWNNDSKAFLKILKKWKHGKGFSVTNQCLDPSIFTEELFKQTHSTILMSGTLKPQSMYRDLLGLEKERTVMKEYESPFPPENRMVLFDNRVTTKFTERNPDMYGAIANNCAEITNQVPGNCAVFFPSYDLMKEVVNDFEINSNKKIIVQDQESDVEHVNSQINKFKLMSDEGAVLMGVMGGRFSEGIDLPGKKLLSVLIVGVPLATPDLEIQSLIKYYDHKFGKGWEYGYYYPAMIKSAQAAGRCVRSETDKGLIVFMDNRYNLPKYRSCIPKEYLQAKGRADSIQQFFSQ